MNPSHWCILLAIALPILNIIFPSGDAPQAIAPPVQAQAIAATPSPVAPEPLSQEVIDYFFEIAFGSEMGAGGTTLRKWAEDLRVQTFGIPTPEDLDTLEEVVAELNQLTDGQVVLHIVHENPNAEIYFVPEAEFEQHEPNYIPRNLGFFWAKWNSSGIHHTRILISTTGVSQEERSHLIREELTQAMGLMQDSYRYEDSIFQQRWTHTQEYSDIDRAIIQLLYRPDIKPGMTQEQVLENLK